jgi:hypothetical protein
MPGSIISPRPQRFSNIEENAAYWRFCHVIFFLVKRSIYCPSSAIFSTCGASQEFVVGSAGWTAEAAQPALPTTNMIAMSLLSHRYHRI